MNGAQFVWYRALLTGASLERRLAIRGAFYMQELNICRDSPRGACCGDRAADGRCAALIRDGIKK